MRDNKELRYLSLISQLGLVMVASILIAMAAGLAIDKWLNCSPIGVLICLLVGILSGFYSVYRTILKEIDKS